MSLKPDASGPLHIESPLMGESLMRRRLLWETDSDALFQPLPSLQVVKLGGQSIIDRGRAVVLPLVEELVAARREHD